MAGLQELKFDPENNTPEELAQKYKDDGNFEFKHKNYRLAIINYTEGIKAKCDNSELNATLYNNRSASHFYLKNYRSALNDCISALIIKPDYLKAKKRAIECAFSLKDYEQCIKFCDDYLVGDNDHDILKMRIKAVEHKTKAERDKRKQAMEEIKEKLALKTTVEILNERKIKFFDKKLLCGDLKYVPQPNYEPILKNPINVKNNILHWPILFLYPEYLTIDCLQSVPEATTINDNLQEIFGEKPDWDVKNEYKPENLNAYFENRYLGQVFLLSKTLTLEKITSQKNFIVYDGALSFYIVPKDSQAEKDFVNQTRVKMT